MKKPSANTLNKIDMSKILDNIPDNDTNKHYIDQEAGEEHYRLLVWLGKKVKGRILELGTFRGHSALCLGLGCNDVDSYDVSLSNLSINSRLDNVNYILGAYGFENITNEHSLLFIDTLHDGKYEREVLNHLREIKWKGIVVLDDIVLFPELAKLWDEIPERKEDWTDIGHHSGTGIVFFD